jgi:F-type H+-transporting ATPase subunit delta
MSELITVARPYALAAFDEAQRLNVLSAWSDMLQSLSDAVQDEQVRVLILSSRVPKVQIESLMLVLGGSKLSVTQSNFIRILLENHRLILLPEIAVIFEMMRAEAEKVVDVIVTSAFDLSESQKQTITTALKARIQREIRLDCKVDPELLGGVVIRAGDRVIDGSACTRLSELANALA